MGSPTAVGEIGLGSSAIGGVTGAIGGLFSGISQQRMYNYQAAVAQINAQIAQQNAEYSYQVGEQKSQQYGIQSAQQFGQIKAAQSSSGLDVNSGSALQTQQSQKFVSSMDLAQIRSDAAKTAYNYDVEATQYENQATLDKSAGANALTAGFINAGSSLLGGASSVASKWLQGQQMGLWGGTSGGGGPSSGWSFDTMQLGAG